MFGCRICHPMQFRPGPSVLDRWLACEHSAICQVLDNTLCIELINRGGTDRMGTFSRRVPAMRGRMTAAAASSPSTAAARRSVVAGNISGASSAPNRFMPCVDQLIWGPKKGASAGRHGKLHRLPNPACQPPRMHEGGMVTPRSPCARSQRRAFTPPGNTPNFGSKGWHGCQQRAQQCPAARSDISAHHWIPVLQSLRHCNLLFKKDQ